MNFVEAFDGSLAAGCTNKKFMAKIFFIPQGRKGAEIFFSANAEALREIGFFQDALIWKSDQAGQKTGSSHTDTNSAIMVTGTPTFT